MRCCLQGCWPVASFVGQLVRLRCILARSQGRGGHVRDPGVEGMQIPLGPAKRAVPCPLCNEKFFPASLPFHQKQCEKRRATRVVPCPYCGVEVTQLALPEHIKTCPKGGGKKRASDRSPAPSQSSAHGSAPRPERERIEASLPCEPQFEAQVLDDGRMGCMYCGRFFNPDRIDKHQEICSKLKNARPKGVDGQPTQTAAKVFDAAAARTGKGSAFVSAKKFKEKQEREQAQLAAAQDEKRRTAVPSWKRASAEFQAACRAGRGEAPPPVARAAPAQKSGIECPHCGRHFSEHVADRHIPICAKVINRPKPPPSPGSANRTIKPPGTPGTSPGPGSRARRESPSRTTPRSSDRQVRSSSVPQRLPSMPQSPAASGSGMQAIRDLRRQASSDKLPQLGTPPGTGYGRGSQMSSSTGSLPHGSPGTRKPPTGPRKSTAAGANATQVPPEATLKLEDNAYCYGADSTDNWPDPVAEHAVVRVGLRRSAMMYRLLSQVPQEALARELVDCGVNADSMDQESMIEAIIHQLA